MLSIFKKHKIEIPSDGYYLKKITRSYLSRLSYMKTGVSNMTTETYYIVCNDIDGKDYNLDYLENIGDFYDKSLYLTDFTMKHMEEFADNKYPLILNKNIEIKNVKLTRLTLTLEDLREVKLSRLITECT